MTRRESLIGALAEAAELEQGITCLYLFAAFSLKTHPAEGAVNWVQLERVRHWKAELLSVAREEMTHHGLVLNLLILLGGAPRFSRHSFPHPSRYTPPYTTLALLPFCEEALERFARYEHLHTPEPGHDGEAPPRTIGNLYQEIRDHLGEAARENPKLFIGPGSYQVSNQELRIAPGQHDVDLVKAHDLSSAQALIDRILVHDHYERMVAIREEFAELRRVDASFQPARPVQPNPGTRHGEAGVHKIRHPLTRVAAELCNDAYEVMILLLERLYGRSNESEAEVDGLLRMSFFPLMTGVIRPLGELLTQMPIDDDPTQGTAGAPFEVPFALPLQPFRRGAWVSVHERLQEAAIACGQLVADLEETDGWAIPLRSRFRLLHENLEAIAAKFERHMDLKREYVRHMLGGVF
jgi:hypothetical protein